MFQGLKEADSHQTQPTAGPPGPQSDITSQLQGSPPAGKLFAWFFKPNAKWGQHADVVEEADGVGAGSSSCHARNMDVGVRLGLREHG